MVELVAATSDRRRAASPGKEALDNDASDDEEGEEGILESGGRDRCRTSSGRGTAPPSMKRELQH